MARVSVRNGSPLGAPFGVGWRPFELERGDRRVVDLAQVVVDAGDVEPVAVRVDHAPRCQVVERRAPQDGLLAARVHRDVPADARGVGRGRVDGEHETGFLRRLRDLLRDDAGARVDRGVVAVDARQARHLDGTHADQLFRVDDGRHGRERNRAARVAGAAAARDDGQPEFDAALHEAGHLVFRIRHQDEERIFDAPVGGIRHVRRAVHAVEADVALVGVAAQHGPGALAQVVGIRELAAEVVDGLACGHEQLLDGAAAACGRGRIGVAGIDRQAALVDFRQAVVQRFDQLGAALRVVQQVVLQIRVAAHDPDIAQDFVQHARRAPGLAGTAQFVKQLPR